jgi:hypothetical protein
MTDETTTTKKTGLKPIEIGAGAGAAVITAFASSYLGTAGTLAGAAVASVVGTVSTSVLRSSADASAQRLRARTAQLRDTRVGRPGPSGARSVGSDIDPYGTQLFGTPDWIDPDATSTLGAGPTGTEPTDPAGTVPTSPFGPGLTGTGPGGPVGAAPHRNGPAQPGSGGPYGSGATGPGGGPVTGRPSSGPYGSGPGGPGEGPVTGRPGSGPYGSGPGGTQATGSVATGPGGDRPPAIGSGWRFRGGSTRAGESGPVRPRWVVLAAGAVAAFALALVAITGIESAAGKPLAGLVGKERGGGTTLGRATGSDGSTQPSPTPTPSTGGASPTSTSTRPSSPGSPSGGLSATPAPSATSPNPAPSPSQPAPTQAPTTAPNPRTSQTP